MAARGRVLALLLGAVVAGAAGAGDTAFVAAARLQAPLVLASPPAPDSTQQQRELAELHQIEAQRSAEQVARAQADEKNETIFLFRELIGEKFNAGLLPLTARLSDDVGRDEEGNASPVKAAYARVRPYNADKSLKPVCKVKAKNDSYPSGHATAGWLQALTLAELLPAKRDAILARAAAYADNRLVCGVHYRSDIEAGKLLAYSLHAVMREDAQYQKELAAARAELERVLGRD